MSSSATSTRLSVNRMNAAASSTRSAVPRPIAKGKVPAEATVAAPRAAVATPTPTNKAVPRVMPEATVSPFLRTGFHAFPISSSPLPTNQISAMNKAAATPISARIAIPRVMFTTSVVPADPSNAVTAPIPAKTPIPMPIPAATVPPFSITGLQAKPTCSNALPRRMIAPVINSAAAVTSTTMSNPNPRFFARDVRLGESLVLTVVSNVLVTSVTDSNASLVLLTPLTPLILEKRSNATTKPPSISTIPMTKAILSTPLQSPVRIASTMLSISPRIVAKPWITTAPADSLMLSVKIPTAIATLERPLIAVAALSQLTPFSVISLIAMQISPRPWMNFNAPPNS